jgi:hypothetical protein
MPSAAFLRHQRSTTTWFEKLNGMIMADKSSLGRVGLFFGGITFAVMLVAVVVVQSHLEGRLALDEATSGPQVVSFSTH